MDYLRRGGMDAQPAPWQCDDVRAHVYYVKGDMTKLEQLCDRCLNLTGAPRYTPVLDFVALTFQRFEGMFSDGGPNTSQQGRHHYSEASFWVLVSNGVDTRVFIPYMFVDNWIALAAGREIYGFPKEFAEVEMPTASNGDTAAVTALALRLAGPERAKNTMILECAPAPGGLLQTAVGLAVSNIDNLWQHVETDAVFSAFFGPVAEFMRMLRSPTLPIAFLRQIRALQGGGAADLLRVVKADVHPFNVSSMPRILPPHELTLTALDSHPIAKELGLTPGANGRFDVPLAIEVVIDNFRLLPGQVLGP